MKKIIAAACIAASLFTFSCTNRSAETAKLQHENDSLMQLNEQTKAEFNDMLQLMNEVEDGFRQIKEPQNYLVSQKNATGEVNLSTREKLKNDMSLVTETLLKNKEKLEALQKQLSNSRYQSSELKKTVERLTAEIDTKTAMIVSLQEELAKKDVRITELDEAVGQLSGKVENLTSVNTQQQEVLESQDKALNMVFYVFGTNKELKDEKIVKGGGLFSSKKIMDGDFNKAYFTKSDLRKLKEIPLEAKKAKVLTNHPDGTYEFVKGSDGMLTFVITQPENFWSLGRYLVIEVD